jgi:hypothetical protein
LQFEEQLQVLKKLFVLESPRGPETKRAVAIEGFIAKMMAIGCNHMLAEITSQQKLEELRTTIKI